MEEIVDGFLSWPYQTVRSDTSHVRRPSYVCSSNAASDADPSSHSGDTEYWNASWSRGRADPESSAANASARDWYARSWPPWIGA
jgi:hypothetical protein